MELTESTRITFILIFWILRWFSHNFTTFLCFWFVLSGTPQTVASFIIFLGLITLQNSRHERQSGVVCFIKKWWRRGRKMILTLRKSLISSFTSFWHNSLKPYRETSKNNNIDCGGVSKKKRYKKPETKMYIYLFFNNARTLRTKNKSNRCIGRISRVLNLRGEWNTQILCKKMIILKILWNSS